MALPSGTDRALFTVYIRCMRWTERGMLERVFGEANCREIEAECAPARVNLDNAIANAHQGRTRVLRQKCSLWVVRSGA